MVKNLLYEQENYWKTHNKIEVVLNEAHIHFIASLLREDDQSKVTSEFRRNAKRDLRFLLHLDAKRATEMKVGRKS